DKKFRAQRPSISADPFRNILLSNDLKFPRFSGRKCPDRSLFGGEPRMWEISYRERTRLARTRGPHETAATQLYKRRFSILLKLPIESLNTPGTGSSTKEHDPDVDFNLGLHARIYIRSTFALSLI
ncbi:hypothetical protein GWI33_011794, partial [Rhynchophorus ferrugineus]